MGRIASQITSLTIVCTTVYSGADQRKHQSSASLAFVRGIHRRPVNSPHKWPVTRKIFPFDDVIMFQLLAGHMFYSAIFFRVASLRLGQSDDYPSTSEVTRKDMGKIDLSQPTEIRLRLILVHIYPLKTRSCNIPKLGGKNWRQSWHHDNSRFFSVRTYFACVTLGQFDWPNLIRVKLSKIVLKSRNRRPSRWLFLETIILVWNLYVRHNWH